VSHLFPDARFLAYLELVECLADDPTRAPDALKTEAEIEPETSFDIHGAVASIALTALKRALETDSLFGPTYAWEDAAIALDGEAILHEWEKEHGPPPAESENRWLDWWIDSWFRSHRLDGERAAKVYPIFVTLFREIFGNPFRRGTFVPSWRTDVVLALARAAYEQCLHPQGHLDPVRLCILADALEEAGCTDYETLGHLREPRPHYRGCWALDLCLAKGAQ
jgi:hypothetical protein